MKLTTVVLLETELGSIEIAVCEDKAPLSSASFLVLPDAGLYDGTAFYRTVSPENDNGSPPISVIQGGVPDAGTLLPSVAHETTADTRIRHRDGVVSLARSEPGTASGAAFFICIGAQPAFDVGGTRNADCLGFAAFGAVISGMDVVHAIHRQPADGPSDFPYMEGQILSDYVEILSASRR